MKRVAWAVLLLAACGKEPREPPPITNVEELDTLPNKKNPGVAPRQQQTLDQVLECFAEPLSVPVPNSISSVTLGDYDNDGRTDVIVTYETLDDQVFTGHVVTYRNTGDAKLVEHATIEAGDMVYAVSSADIDADGNLDLAVGDPRGGKVRLYAGKGDGSFTAKPPVVGRKPYGATLVDLDADGKLDLITEVFSDVQIFKGDGKFGFKK